MYDYNFNAQSKFLERINKLTIPSQLKPKPRPWHAGILTLSNFKLPRPVYMSPAGRYKLG